MTWSSNHFKLLSWTWKWVHCFQMAKVTGPESNRAPLECGEIGDSYRHSCSNCVMLSCQYGPESLRNVSGILFNYALRQFWRQKGQSNPVLARYTLTNWLVSVCYTQRYLCCKWNAFFSVTYYTEYVSANNLNLSVFFPQICSLYT